MTIRIILPQNDGRYGKLQLAPVRIFPLLHVWIDAVPDPCRVVVRPSWAEHLVYQEIRANVQELIVPW
jgi:hypothetical protein